MEHYCVFGASAFSRCTTTPDQALIRLASASPAAPILQFFAKLRRNSLSHYAVLHQKPLFLAKMRGTPYRFKGASRLKRQASCRRSFSFRSRAFLTHVRLRLPKTRSIDCAIVSQANKLSSSLSVTSTTSMPHGSQRIHAARVSSTVQFPLVKSPALVLHGQTS